MLCQFRPRKRKKIRNRTGYSSFFMRFLEQNWLRLKHSISKELGYRLLDQGLWTNLKMVIINDYENCVLKSRIQCNSINATIFMILLSDYLSFIPPAINPLKPWIIPTQIPSIISDVIKSLSNEYIISNGNAVHHTATIEPGAILKPPYIIGPNCFIASYAYLRGGVWLESDVIIGPACEIKSSLILRGSKAAHFNFIGDSIIGSSVNIEAGAIIANYRNELVNKEIVCFSEQKKITTGVDKFGAILGDGCKIGANAVLAPGTILKPETIVGRLTLIDDHKQ